MRGLYRVRKKQVTKALTTYKEKDKIMLLVTFYVMSAPMGKF